MILTEPGLMMDFPLTLTHVLERSALLYAKKQMASRTPDGMHRYTYREFGERVHRRVSIGQRSAAEEIAGQVRIMAPPRGKEDQEQSPFLSSDIDSTVFRGARQRARKHHHTRRVGHHLPGRHFRGNAAALGLVERNISRFFPH